MQMTVLRIESSAKASYVFKHYPAVDADTNDELNQWINRFKKDEYAAAYEF